MNSQVNITFYGMNHHALNVSAVENLKNSITQWFEEYAKEGKQLIIFYENAEGTYADTSSLEDDINKNGFLKQLISALLIKRKKHSEENVNKFISLLKNVSLEDIVKEKNLIPAQFLQAYYKYKLFDELKLKWNYKVVLENHSDETFKKSANLHQQSRTDFAAAIQKWEDGKFSEANDLSSKHNATLVESLKLRDQGILQQLQKLIEQLSITEAGGAVFMIFGHAHENINYELKNNKTYTNLSFKSIIDPNLGREEFPHDPMVESGDLYFGRSILQELIAKQVSEFFGKRNILYYIINYQSLLNLRYTMVRSLTQESLQKICEDKLQISITQASDDNTKVEEAT